MRWRRTPRGVRRIEMNKGIPAAEGRPAAARDVGWAAMAERGGDRLLDAFPNRP